MIGQLVRDSDALFKLCINVYFRRNNRFRGCRHKTFLHYTLSGRTGSALVWHSEVAGSRLTQCSKSCDLQPALQCAIRGAEGVLPCVGWGYDQSIGSTVSDAIVRSWLWLTASRSSPLGYFGNYCK